MSTSRKINFWGGPLSGQSRKNLDSHKKGDYKDVDAAVDEFRNMMGDKMSDTDKLSSSTKKEGASRAGEEKSLTNEKMRSRGEDKGARKRKGMGDKEGPGDDRGELFEEERGKKRNMGDSMLQSMQRMSTEQVQEKQVSDSKETELSSLCQKLADRILVEKEAVEARGEVRIRLKDEVLPSTEIRILRAKGRLLVELYVGADVSRQFFQDNGANLQRYLKKHIDSDVDVMLVASEKEKEENEGRSRNRRDILEEWIDQ